MTSTLATAPATSVASASRLFRFAVAFAALTLLHIKWGALVVSSGSGMAFTDWPLSRGSLWPADMTRNELVEHLHRYFGALLGLLAIGLAVWTCRVDPRPWLRKATIGLVFLFGVQGLLGGWGVVYGKLGGVTNPWFATGHGILGQLTLCAQVFIAFALSPSFQTRLRADAIEVAATRKLATAALVAVFFQLVLGAVFRHTNVQGVLWVHISMALIVAVLVLLSAAHSSSRFGAKHPSFRTTATWFYVLLLAQLTLGFAAIAVRRFKDPQSIHELGQVLVISSHVLVGAALFALTTLLVARAWRNLLPAVGEA